MTRYTFTIPRTKPTGTTTYFVGIRKPRKVRVKTLGSGIGQ